LAGNISRQAKGIFNERVGRINKHKESGKTKIGPKVLLLDIETAPILARVWKMFDENIGLEQIEKDWHILSWAAKWLNDPPSKIIYQDQRHAENIEDDSHLLKEIWNLIDAADIVITQNGVSFDMKKLNARFIMNGMKPPSSYKNIDTKLIAKSKFAFTSNKLEYMTDKLCKKYKKLKHNKYPGFSLWSEVLKGNMSAWKEMEKYNKFDVLSLEELWKKLAPWDSTINFSVYTDTKDHVCSCGSKKFKRDGLAYTSTGTFQRYACLECGSRWQSRENLLSKEKRKSLLSGTK